MAIIFTVSSITLIPIVYWSIAGLGVAYAVMLERAGFPGPARRTGRRTAVIAAGS
jgi:hypothetical protein